jgi:hypothetical protein
LAPKRAVILTSIAFPAKEQEYFGPEQGHNIAFNYISSVRNNILSLKRAIFIPTPPIFPGCHGFQGAVKFFREAAEKKRRATKMLT